jgi:hypothetical protein
LIGIGIAHGHEVLALVLEPMSWWPACSSAQKCARKANVSAVVPDLVAMMWQLVSG